MAAELTIRRSEPGELEAFVSVRNHAEPLLAADVGIVDLELSGGYRPSTERWMAAVEGSIVGVAWLDGKASEYPTARVGVLPAFRSQGIGRALAEACRAFGLPQLYSEYTLVRPERRGRGIGRRMKEAQIAWAQANGIERIVTDIPNKEPIRRILKRLGYQPWERVSASRICTVTTNVT